MSVASDYTRADPTAIVADEASVHFGRPVVFGNPARPLVGRLHESRVPVRGAVVLCSPIGYEENCAFATFQALARQLAQRGFETLRFDYDGSGNSWGDAGDADRVAAWVDSCSAAVHYMAQRSGQRVHALGLRMGAALALMAAGRCTLDRVVLWDPVVSGRRYLRTLRAMSMMGVDAAPDPQDPGSLVVIGNMLSAATVRTIEELNCKTIDRPRIGSALIVGRPHSADPARLMEVLGGHGIAASCEEITGTAELMDCAAEQSVIPQAIVTRIVDFFVEGSGDPQPPRFPLPRSATLESPTVSGWTEEHLTLGSRGLAAVLTVPRTVRRQGVVVMTNNGVARCIGPARAWVEWARLWASLGIASLRVDLSGLGDSAPQQGQLDGVGYPIESLDDLASVVTELRARQLTPAVAVGLCSGAFLSLDAAAAGAGFAGVVAINPQLFYLPDAPGSADRLRRAAPPAHPWVQRFLENTRVGRRLARLLPYPAWWLLDRLGLHPSPLHGANAAAARSRVLLIYGDDNIGLKYLRRRAGTGALRDWLASGRMVIVDGLDHSMFAPQIRLPVEQLTRTFLLELLPADVTGERPASAP